MEKIILQNSPEAAEYRTDVAGWVSHDGYYFGESEKSARWRGCTRVKCEQCGAVYKKDSYCKKCRAENEERRFKAMPTKRWDRSLPVYEGRSDRYFWNVYEVYEYLIDNRLLLESLRLIICEPIYLRTVNEEYFADYLADDEELSREVEDALEVFNSIIEHQPPVSWTPGNYAVALKWVNDAVWWNPATWGRGHYEL